MTDAIGRGSLKIVAGCSSKRSLSDVLHETLVAHAGDSNVRDLHGDTFLVHTDADPETIRDWIAPLLVDDESVFVGEFERWSSHGPAADTAWLLRRGH